MGCKCENNCCILQVSPPTVFANAIVAKGRRNGGILQYHVQFEYLCWKFYGYYGHMCTKNFFLVFRTMTELLGVFEVKQLSVAVSMNTSDSVYYRAPYSEKTFEGENFREFCRSGTICESFLREKEAEPNGFIAHAHTLLLYTACS